MLNIEPPFTGRYAFLHTGFRPFFALAALGAVGLMLLWLGVFGLGWTGLPMVWPMVSWHAHEMIYGFGLAVVAGFLLTAVRNWTHLPTLEGYPLLGLALLWVVARVLPLWPSVPMYWAAFAEWAFLVMLLVVITRPVIRVRQWGQMSVIGKVALLLPASLAFHLGVTGVWPEGTGVGLYAGFYLLLGLVLTLGRRVMPMFIERGLNNGFVVRNDPRVDRWSLVLFVVFAVADTWSQMRMDPAMLLFVSVLALLQAGLHGWRIAGWYHRDVWKIPMVWVLVLGYLWLVLGFVLKALTGVGLATQSVATHAFAAGGVGLVTLGMMARVTLGHTARNVNAPPAGVFWVFVLATLAGVFRVLGVWLFPAEYGLWILFGQASWVAAFGLFAVIYLPMLVQARIDRTRG